MSQNPKQLPNFTKKIRNDGSNCFQEYTFFIVSSTCIANAALGTRKDLIGSRLNNTKVY